MARMHSRKHGKAGSKHPLAKTAPVWVAYKPKEIETLILKLAKQGYSSSMIGLVLRDSYGIPNVKLITGKKIAQILKEHDLSTALPEDLTALIKRYVALTKHYQSNKRDLVSKRGLQLTESKIKRLAKYYISKGILPDGWRFDKSKAKLLIE